MTPPPKQWFAATVKAAPEAAEAIESAFNSANSLGTEINYLKDRDPDLVRVIGYFDTRPKDGTLEDELRRSIHDYGLSFDSVRDISWQTVEDEDWLAEWKKHWQPSVVGRFVISPPWLAPEENGKIAIFIEPNMAFGTGTHETTQLCLKAIEKLYRPGDSLADVGTGTGILAIAAAKLATTLDSETPKIFACDTDAEAVSLARENAKMNGVDGHIEFDVGPLSAASGQYDLVVANLTADVILEMMDLLLEKSRKALVLSGILTEQEPMIAASLRQRGITGFSVEGVGEWISITVEKH